MNQYVDLEGYVRCGVVNRRAISMNRCSGGDGVELMASGYLSEGVRLDAQVLRGVWPLLLQVVRQLCACLTRYPALGPPQLYLHGRTCSSGRWPLLPTTLRPSKSLSAICHQQPLHVSTPFLTLVTPPFWNSHRVRFGVVILPLSLPL